MYVLKNGLTNVNKMYKVFGRPTNVACHRGTGMSRCAQNHRNLIAWERRIRSMLSLAFLARTITLCPNRNHTTFLFRGVQEIGIPRARFSLCYPPQPGLFTRGFLFLSPLSPILLLLMLFFVLLFGAHGLSQRGDIKVLNNGVREIRIVDECVVDGYGGRWPQLLATAFVLRDATNSGARFRPVCLFSAEAARHGLRRRGTSERNVPLQRPKDL